MDIISRALNNLCCFDNSYPELGYILFRRQELLSALLFLLFFLCHIPIIRFQTVYNLI